MNSSGSSRKTGGFPHSEIHGSTPVCGSPWLIAAYHVLHRLLEPRHSPSALSSLIANYIFGVSLLRTLLTEPSSRIFPVSRRFTVLPLHMQFSKNFGNTSLLKVHLAAQAFQKTNASKFVFCFGDLSREVELMGSTDR